MAPLPRPDMGQFLPYILELLQASTWGRCPPKPVLYSNMPPPQLSSFRLTQTSFEPNLYPYNYPSNLFPVILFIHMIYDDGTECSEMLAHKIRMPGNHPKRQNTTFTTWQRFQIKNFISMLTSACQRVLIPAKLIQCMSIQPCPL